MIFTSSRVMKGKAEYRTLHSKDKSNVCILKYICIVYFAFTLSTYAIRYSRPPNVRRVIG